MNALNILCVQGRIVIEVQIPFNPFWTIVPVEEQIIKKLEKPVGCFVSKRVAKFFYIFFLIRSTVTKY